MDLVFSAEYLAQKKKRTQSLAHQKEAHLSAERSTSKRVPARPLGWESVGKGSRNVHLRPRKDKGAHQDTYEIPMNGLLVHPGMRQEDEEETLNRKEDQIEKSTH